MPVTMRVKPTSVEYSQLAITDNVNYSLAVTALTINWNSPSVTQVTATTGNGATQYRPALLTNNNNTAGYIALNAEL